MSAEEPVDQFNDIFDFLNFPVKSTENSVIRNDSPYVEDKISILDLKTPTHKHAAVKTKLLAQRIAEADRLVSKIHKLEADYNILQLQLKELKQSAQVVHTLYENEKSEHTTLKASNKILREKYEILDAENYKLKHENDQLEARLSDKINIKQYDRLAVRYIKLSQKPDDYLSHGSHQAYLKKLYNYCTEKKLNGVPSVLSSPRRATKKLEKATQCALIKDQPERHVTTCSVSVQAVSTETAEVKATRSQGTQHKNSTTTRGTSTDCFIKKHNVSTMFPEKALSVDNILREFLDWEIRMPISPIVEMKQVSKSMATQTETDVKTRAMGTCTYICNVQRQVDYLPIKPIKRSISRPPSRIATTDEIKSEMSTTTPTPTPTVSRRNSISMQTQENIGFGELWNIFGQMILCIIKSQAGSNINITPQVASSTQTVNNIETFNQQEFNNWLYSVYETTQQPYTAQQQQNTVQHNCVHDTVTAAPQTQLPLMLNSTLIRDGNIVQPEPIRRCATAEAADSHKSFALPNALQEQKSNDMSVTSETHISSNSKVLEKSNPRNVDRTLSTLPQRPETCESTAANETRNAIAAIPSKKHAHKAKQKRHVKKRKLRKLKKQDSSNAKCENALQYLCTLFETDEQEEEEEADVISEAEEDVSETHTNSTFLEMQANAEALEKMKGMLLADKTICQAGKTLNWHNEFQQDLPKLPLSVPAPTHKRTDEKASARSTMKQIPNEHHDLVTSTNAKRILSSAKHDLQYSPHNSDTFKRRKTCYDNVSMSIDACISPAKQDTIISGKDKPSIEQDTILIEQNSAATAINANCCNADILQLSSDAEVSMDRFLNKPRSTRTTSTSTKLLELFGSDTNEFDGEHESSGEVDVVKENKTLNSDMLLCPMIDSPFTSLEDDLDISDSEDGDDFVAADTTPVTAPTPQNMETENSKQLDSTSTDIKKNEDATVVLTEPTLNTLDSRVQKSAAPRDNVKCFYPLLNECMEPKLSAHKNGSLEEHVAVIKQQNYNTNPDKLLDSALEQNTRIHKIFHDVQVAPKRPDTAYGMEECSLKRANDQSLNVQAIVHDVKILSMVDPHKKSTTKASSLQKFNERNTNLQDMTNHVHVAPIKSYTEYAVAEHHTKRTTKRIEENLAKPTAKTFTAPSASFHHVQALSAEIFDHKLATDLANTTDFPDYDDEESELVIDEEVLYAKSKVDSKILANSSVAESTIPDDAKLSTSSNETEEALLSSSTDSQSTVNNMSLLLDSKILNELLSDNDENIVNQVLNDSKAIMMPIDGKAAVHTTEHMCTATNTPNVVRKRGRPAKRKATTPVTPQRLACKRSERLLAKHLVLETTRESIVTPPDTGTQRKLTRSAATKKLDLDVAKDTEFKRKFEKLDYFKERQELGDASARVPTNCDKNEIQNTSTISAEINIGKNDAIRHKEIVEQLPNHSVVDNFQKADHVQVKELNVAANEPLASLCVNTDVVDRNSGPRSPSPACLLDSPASPTPTPAANEHAPLEIPFKPITKYEPRHSNLMKRLVGSFDAKLYALVKPTATTVQENEHTIMRLKVSFNYYITNQNETDDKLVAEKLHTALLNISPNWPLIITAIVQYIQHLPRTEPATKPTLATIKSRLIVVFQYLEQQQEHIIAELRTKIDATLFHEQCTDKFDLPQALNLTQLYLLLLDQQPAMHANPSRLFIAKCIYYHAHISAPLIYEVLCQYPTTLPHREERAYDHSDAIITVIKHYLMCTKYDMDNQELRTRELLSKLRFEYHFEPFQPLREEVLQNLLDKLHSGKLLHLSYAFAIFCKRIHPTKVLTEIIEARLMPITAEYFANALQSDAYDARIAVLLECISMAVKPMPVETNVKLFLNIFEHFYNVIQRPVVQEAAIQSILRLQRFGYANCYNALVNWHPTFELQACTKAMLRTFVYRKPLHFWKTLQEQASVISN